MLKMNHEWKNDFAVCETGKTQMIVVSCLWLWMLKEEMICSWQQLQMMLTICQLEQSKEVGRPGGRQTGKI